MFGDPCVSQILAIEETAGGRARFVDLAAFADGAVWAPFVADLIDLADPHDLAAHGAAAAVATGGEVDRLCRWGGRLSHGDSTYPLPIRYIGGIPPFHP